ncbi:polysaccharide deacetylase family protein [Paenibacillus glycanilyticus]|uniref:polysaccharide deacetylase family protein n=1 Tax=Paenibacillus glycanilyticus TaxID=126569 RepID=UPI000FDAF5E0|nr:polysaccharide deacetylase family protein [Paenibacillus glycanilyticus]
MTKTTMNTLCAVFALTALLTSCGSASETTTGSANALPTAHSADAQSPPGRQTLPAPETPALSATPAAEPSPSPKVMAPLYKMTAVYRFVPINEATASKKAVLLTFDDAPHNEEVINSLLDTLDKHKAKAIFFVNGYRVKQHPELLKLIHDRGQTIGNHSWDHIDLKKEEPGKVETQIADVQAEVKALTGKEPKFFRPPYGSGGDTVKEAAKNHGMLFMTWSNGSLDWEQKAPGDPDKVIGNVLEQLHPGANILMHELKWTAAALDGLLAKLEDKGYSFIDPETIQVSP